MNLLAARPPARRPRAAPVARRARRRRDRVGADHERPAVRHRVRHDRHPARAGRPPGRRAGRPRARAADPAAAPPIVQADPAVRPCRGVRPRPLRQRGDGQGRDGDADERRRPPRPRPRLHRRRPACSGCRRARSPPAPSRSAATSPRTSAPSRATRSPSRCPAAASVDPPGLGHRLDRRRGPRPRADRRGPSRRRRQPADQRRGHEPGGPRARRSLPKIPPAATAADPATAGAAPAGSTSPVFAPEPAVRRELHVQLDHAQLPGDPVAAQTVARHGPAAGRAPGRRDRSPGSTTPARPSSRWRPTSPGARSCSSSSPCPGILLALALSRLAADATADATRRHAALLRARGATRRRAPDGVRRGDDR